MLAAAQSLEFSWGFIEIEGFHGVLRVLRGIMHQGRSPVYVVRKTMFYEEFIVFISITISYNVIIQIRLST